MSGDIVSADAANDVLWAEFQRRRRADREVRRKRISEVQQILLEVQQERLNSLDVLLLDSPAKRALNFSPSPQKPSEVQQILAEVQQERLAAAISLASVPPSVKQPFQAASLTPSSLCAQTVPTKLYLCSEASQGFSAANIADTSAVRGVRLHGSSRNLRTSSPSCRTPVARSLQKIKSPSCAAPKPRAASTSPSRSSETRPSSAVVRTLQRPAGQSNASPETQYVLGPKPKPEAYPAGGWDDRISCPPTFDGFPGGVLSKVNQARVSLSPSNRDWDRERSRRIQACGWESSWLKSSYSIGSAHTPAPEPVQPSEAASVGDGVESRMLVDHQETAAAEIDRQSHRDASSFADETRAVRLETSL